MKKEVRNKETNQNDYYEYPTKLLIPVNTFSELFECVIPAI